MANTLETIYTMWLREVKRFIRSRARLIGSGGQPFIWLALFGVGLASAFANLPNGVSYLAFIAVGIIGMNILFSSVVAGVLVVFDRQLGFLKEILVAPIPRIGIVLGKIAGTVTISMVMALVILVIVLVLGIIPLSHITAIGILEAIALMMLISATFVSIGLILAANIESMEGLQVIYNFLLFPLFFLSGALFPLTDAPLWLKGLSAIDPLTYAVDGMRGALLGFSTYPIWLDGLIVIVVTIFLIGVADFMFRRMQGK